MSKAVLALERWMRIKFLVGLSQVLFDFHAEL